MGGLCSSDTVNTPSSTSTVSNTSIPTWVSEGGERLFNQASALAERPFEAYTGPRVADFTPDTQSAFAGVRANQGAYQPQLAEAGALTTQAGKSFDQAAYEQYANPFQQNVTDMAGREMNRQYDQALLGQNAQAQQAGAFGGSRHGILNAENERNRMQNMADLQFRGAQQGFQNAQQMFGTDQARALQAGSQAGQLGSLQSQMGYQDAQALQGIGSQQQALEQQSVDAAYGDYLEQREYPFRQTNFALGALRGTPYETRTTSTGSGTSTQLAPSILGQAGGALGALGGFARG
tara:strand:+ start:796 stop:1671 length:876 start_codon:yes stop_codon:yes gene_type:complete